MLYSRNGSAIASNQARQVTSGTSTYTYTSSGHVYSPIYSSTATTARVWEQIFTQQSDPRPHTPDWTNEITSFDASDWQYFRVSASGHRDLTANGMEGVSTPLVRAYSTLPYNSYSATLPVDGINFNWDYKTGRVYGNIPETFSGKYPSAEDQWAPISSIIGSATGPLHACVATYLMTFGGWKADSANNTGNPSWLKLPNGSEFSGAIQFMRDIDGTGESTGFNTGMVTVHDKLPLLEKTDHIDYVIFNFTSTGNFQQQTMQLDDLKCNGKLMTAASGESDDRGFIYTYPVSYFSEGSCFIIGGSGYVKMSANSLHSDITCNFRQVGFNTLGYTSNAYKNGEILHTTTGSVQSSNIDPPIHLYNGKE